MPLAIVKMKDVEPPFSAQYYIGEDVSRKDGGAVLTNPVRCVEALIPRDIPTRVVGPNQQQNTQRVLEPSFQDLAEVACEGTITIPSTSIMHVAVIKEDSWLTGFYKEAVKQRAEILKNAQSASSLAPKPLDN